MKASREKFKALDDHWCDTAAPQGRAVSDDYGRSEFECKLIRQRCEAGIARAKANGKHFGRKPVVSVNAGQRKRISERYIAGETMSQLAREYDRGVATIYRAIGG